MKRLIFTLVTLFFITCSENSDDYKEPESETPIEEPVEEVYTKLIRKSVSWTDGDSGTPENSVDGNYYYYTDKKIDSMIVIDGTKRFPHYFTYDNDRIKTFQMIYNAASDKEIEFVYSENNKLKETNHYVYYSGYSYSEIYTYNEDGTVLSQRRENDTGYIDRDFDIMFMVDENNNLLKTDWLGDPQFIENEFDDKLSPYAAITNYVPELSLYFSHSINNPISRTQPDFNGSNPKTLLFENTYDEDGYLTSTRTQGSSRAIYYFYY